MHPLTVLGLSMKPVKQVHFAKPDFNIVHCVFGPQGEGLQGFCGKAHGICGGVPSYSGKQKQI